MAYNPKEYWERRLSERFNLSGVGHADFSEHYNKWLYKAKNRGLKKALTRHNIEIHNSSVCDIGCGTGFFVDFYLNNGVKDIFGVDITTNSIEKLKQKYPDNDFIVADITETDMPSRINRKFDIINVFDVLYHIVDSVLFEQALINLTKLVSKKGYIFITDFCGETDVKAAEHVRFRKKDTYTKIFQENGFDIVQVLPLYYILNRGIFTKTRLNKIAHLGSIADNTLASLYYYLDYFLLSLSQSNIKLIIARHS